MARRARTIVRSPTRREMLWLGLFPSSTQQTVAAATAVLIGSLNAAALALRPFTIVRTHLRAHWESDQTSAEEFITGAFGLIVVKETAAAAGVASLPTPATETDGEFFVYESLVESFFPVTAVGILSGTGNGLTLDVDSKAQRKVGTDENVAIIAENAAGAHGAQFWVGGRMLIKLH